MVAPFDFERYTGVLNDATFEEFLHTSQTGFAHTMSGTDIYTLGKTSATSMVLCIIQLTFFCVLRPLLRSIYSPRSYCVPLSERMEPLPDGFFAWVVPTLTNKLGYYQSMGLDAYFFVRFISIFLLFFVGLGSLNMLILLPINWTGSTASQQAQGMDKFSLSNISNAKVTRLNAHFIVALMNLSVLQFLISRELRTFVNIRQNFLTKPMHRDSMVSRTILISRVPEELKNFDVLAKWFNGIPGGIKRSWNLYSFADMEYWVRIASDALKFLELAQTNYQVAHYRKNFKSKSWFSFSAQSQQDKLDAYIENNGQGEIEIDEKSVTKFYPPIYLAPYRLGISDRCITICLPGWLRIFAFQKRVSMYEYALHMMELSHKNIDELKQKLIDGTIEAHDSIFVEFQTSVGVSIASQCLLSSTKGKFDKTYLGVHPGDVVWPNLARSNTFVCSLEKYLVTLCFITIIVLYVVPVSFIGMISQIPLLTQLIPFLRWVYKLPEEARRTISSVIPSILLTLLTEVVMVMFRFLTYYKGIYCGREIEINLQTWYFAFLFVQQFLVVTISSSLTVIIKQVVDEPTSIPFLLAMNIPKAATFFFQYLTIKAFAFCGSNFLRVNQLIKVLFVYHWIDITPRCKFTRLATLPRIRWGTVYPVFSVYICIGIVYCVISPLISVFVAFMLFLALVYYKYALKYIYSHTNTAETHGRLYPTALLHLYTGIYCIECCLIGIFFLVRDQNGQGVMRPQGYLMCLVLFATIFSHKQLYNQYSKFFDKSPVLLDDKDALEKVVENDDSLDECGEYYSSKVMLYFHPSFKYENPRLWLAADPLGVSDALIKRTEAQLSTLSGGMTRGAVVDFCSSYRKFTIQISDAPPDFK